MKWFIAAIVLSYSSVAAAEQAISRIAFGSCAFQSVSQPTFRAIADSKPDLYLSLGDLIYADYDLKKHKTYDVTSETLRREWKVMGNGGVASDFDPLESYGFILEELKAAVNAALDYGTYVAVHAYTDEFVFLNS